MARFVEVLARVCVSGVEPIWPDLNKALLASGQQANDHGRVPGRHAGSRKGPAGGSIPPPVRADWMFVVCPSGRWKKAVARGCVRLRRKWSCAGVRDYDEGGRVRTCEAATRAVARRSAWRRKSLAACGRAWLCREWPRAGARDCDNDGCAKKSGCTEFGRVLARVAALAAPG